MRRIGILGAAALICLGLMTYRGRTAPPKKTMPSPAAQFQAGAPISRWHGFGDATPSAAPPAQRDRLTAANEQVYDLLRTPHNIFNTLEDQAREIAWSPLMLQQLVAMMESPPAMRADGSPQLLSERIRAFDLLETIARLPDVHDVTAETCRSVLTGLVRRPVDKTIAFPRREAIVAEKHDALTAITHINPTLAIELYREFSPGMQRQFMGSALLLGLIDLGLERTAAQRYILSIP